MNIQEWLIEKCPEFEWGILIKYKLENTLIGLHILEPIEKQTDIELLQKIDFNGKSFKYGVVDIELLIEEIDVIKTSYNNNIKEWHNDHICYIHR